MAYKADFNSFSEIIMDDGTVVRRIEQAGGGGHYEIVGHHVDSDAYMAWMGDWFEVEDDEAARWMVAAQESSEA